MNAHLIWRNQDNFYHKHQASVEPSSSGRIPAQARPGHQPLMPQYVQPKNCPVHRPAYVWVWLWGYSSWIITALHRHQGCCMGSLSCSPEHGAPPAWVQTCPNAHSYLPLCALEDTAVGSSSQLTSRQMLFISKLLVSLLSSVTLGEG